MIILFSVSVIVLLGTFIPESSTKFWLVRTQMYLRYYYLILNVCLVATWLLFLDETVFGLIMLLSHFIGSLICARDVLPYSRFGAKRIKTAKKINKDKELKLLVFNVYQESVKYQNLIDLIKEKDPDIVVLLETDEKWFRALLPLRHLFTHEVKDIRKDYGLILWSKIKPNDSSIEFLDHEEVPSIRMIFTYRKKSIHVMALHPKPPIPGEALSSEQKDNEFEEAAAIIGRMPDRYLHIVLGDLNDVVWSKASTKFLKETGLGDPRLGRGTYSTFPTYFPLKFPLDQVFCSKSFELIELAKLENIGSDHYPIFVRLLTP